ncbi:MAG: hypothetical protein JWO69_1041 [Thermoleophilia bacterium]|nr:hypothetical protein [Thermoleophilia bacterium]
MAISAVAEARARNEMVLQIAADSRSARRSARKAEMRHAALRATAQQTGGEPRSAGKVDAYA